MLLNDFSGVAIDGDIKKIVFSVVDSDNQSVGDISVTQDKDASGQVKVGSYSGLFKTYTSGKYKASVKYNNKVIGDEIEVTAQKVVIVSKSSIEGDKPNLLADGVDKLTLTVNLKDGDSENISGELTKLTIKSKLQSAEGDEQPLEVKQVDAQTVQGKYQAIFITSQKGIYNFTASYNGELIGTVSVTAANALTPSKSTLTLDKSSIAANGVELLALSVQLKDGDGNNVSATSDDMVTLHTNVKDSADKKAISLSKSTAPGAIGLYTGSFATTTAGTHEFVAQYDGVMIDNIKSVSAINAVVPSKSTFATPTPTSIAADGVAGSSLKVNLVDSAGSEADAAANASIQVSAERSNAATGEKPIIVTLTKNGSTTGEYVGTFKSTLAGTYTLTASYVVSNGATTQIGSAQQVTTTNAVVPSKSTFATPTPTSIAADGVAGSSLKVNLVDSAGSEADAAANASIQVSAERSNAATGEKPIIVTLTKNGSTTGEYVGTFKSTLAGTYTLTASYVVSNGATTQIGSAQQVTTTNAVVPSKSTFATPTPTSIAADGVAGSSLKVNLVDSAGSEADAAANASIQVSAERSNAATGEKPIIVTLTKNGSTTGEYVGTFKSTLAGTYTLTASYVVSNGATTQIGSAQQVTTTNAVVPSKSIFATPTPTSIAADGVAGSSLKVNLVDSAGSEADAAANASIQVSAERSNAATGEKPIIVTLTKNGSTTGEYVGTFKSTLAGTYTLTASYVVSNGATTQIGSAQQVTTTNAVVPSKSTFATPTPTSIAADGVAGSSLKVNLVDSAGSEADAAANASIQVSAERSNAATGEKPIIVTLTKNGSTTGEYVGTFKSTLAGTYTLTASYVVSNGATTQIGSAQQVTTTNAVVPSKSIFATPTPTSIAADGVAGSSLKVNLVDSAGSEADAAANASIQVSAERSNAATGEKPIIVTLTKNGSTTGEYVGTFKSTLAGTYTLTASYVVSNGATTQIGSAQQVTTTNAVVPSKSTFATPTPTSIAADGVAGSSLKVNLVDSAGSEADAAANASIQVSAERSNAATGEKPIIVTLTKNGSTTGEYVGTFKSTLAGTYTLTASYVVSNGATTQIGSAQQVTTTNAVVPSKSTFATPTPTSIAADGVAGSSLKVNLVDSAGSEADAAANASIQVSAERSNAATGEKPIIVTLTKNGSTTGEYVGTFKSTLAGTYTLTASYVVSNGATTQIGSAQQVTTTNAVVPSKSIFATPTPTSIAADGVAGSSLKVNLVDSAGSEADAAANASIQVSAERSNAATGEKPIIVTLTKNGSTTGEYVGTFKSTLAGTYTLTASYVVSNGATTQIGSAQQVTTTNAVVPSKSTLTVSKDSMSANNVDSVTVTVQLNDSNDDAIATTSDSKVTLKRKLSSEAESAYQVVNLTKVAGATGKYTATFTTTTVGTHQFLAQYDSVMIDSVKTVQAEAVVDASKSTFAINKNPLKADGIEYALFTVTLKDSQNSPIDATLSKINVMVTTSATGSQSYRLNPTKTETGIYTAQLPTRTADTTYTVTADYNGTEIGSKMTVDYIVPSIKGVLANSETKVQTNAPTVAYLGAQFTFSLSIGDMNDYSWTINANNPYTLFTYSSSTKKFKIANSMSQYDMSYVRNGKVTFIGTPKNRSKTKLTYAMAIDTMFYPYAPQTTVMNWTNSQKVCASDNIFPTKTQADALYSYWGNTSADLFTRAWIADAVPGTSKHYGFNYNYGSVDQSATDNTLYSVTCLKKLATN